MQWNSEAWLWALGRTTLMVAVSAVLVAVLLRVLRVRSTALRRAAWCVVPLQGWLAVQIPIVLEREAAPAVESAAVTEVSHAASPTPLPVPDASTVVEQNVTQPAVEEGNQSGTVAALTVDRTARESAGRPIPWTGLLFLVWSVGACLTMVLGAYRYFAFLKLLRSTEPAAGEWQDESREAQKAMRVTKPVDLRVLQDAGPCLVRRLNGSCIVVPRGLWGDLNRSQRMAILRHELAHHVRGDLWKSIGMRLLSLPQWFNPAAWWAVRRFDECAEWACDELAAGGGEGATEYSKLLLALGAAPGGRAAYLPAAHRGCVSTRVRRLVAERRRDGRPARVLVPLVVVALIAAAMLRIDVVAQPASTNGIAARVELPVGDFSPMPWHPDELVAVLGDERGRVWGYPRGLVVTPDGEWLILTTGNGALFLYDAHSLEMVSTFGEPRSVALHLQLSGDGKRLIVGYDDDAIELWDITQEPPVLVETVQLPADYPEPISARYSMSRNADRLVASTGGLVSVWELRQGHLEQIHSITMDETTYNCVLSPDGEWLLTKYSLGPKGGEPVPPDRHFEIDGIGYVRRDCVLRVWDISGAKASETDRVVTTNVGFLSFLPDGATVCAEPDITEPDRGLRQWDFADGELTEAEDVDVDLAWFPGWMAYSQDGRLLAGVRSESPGGVVLMDVSQKPWRDTASLAVKRPSTIAFTPDEDAILLCAWSSLQRWNRSDSGGYERVTPEPIESGSIADIVFSREGDRLISCGGSVREWNLLQPGSHVPIVTDLDETRIGSMAWVPGRDAFITQTSTDQQRIQLWGRNDGRYREEWSIDFGDDYRDSAWCLAIDPRGRLLATGHHDAAIRFWNVEGDSPVKAAELERAHDGHVCGVEFSRDGSMLASVGWDGAVKLWDASTDPPSEGGELGKHEEIVRRVAFSPDSRWLASGDDAGLIRLWDLESKDLSGPTIRHPDDVAPPASPYSGRGVYDLEFSSDNRRLLSCDNAGRVVVWSVPSGEIIQEWRFPGWVGVARWSPDESLIATANANGTVYLLTAPAGE